MKLNHFAGGRWENGVKIVWREDRIMANPSSRVSLAKVKTKMTERAKNVDRASRDFFYPLPAGPPKIRAILSGPGPLFFFFFLRAPLQLPMVSGGRYSLTGGEKEMLRTGQRSSEMLLLSEIWNTTSDEGVGDSGFWWRRSTRGMWMLKLHVYTDRVRKIHSAEARDSVCLYCLTTPGPIGPFPYLHWPLVIGFVPPTMRQAFRFIY